MSDFDPFHLRGQDQLCFRCGRHEIAGSYCTFCRTAEYDLADHPSHGHTYACPVGWRPDPVNATKADLKRWRTVSEVPLNLAGTRRRHHPRAVGHTPESDPRLPSWAVYHEETGRLGATPPAWAAIDATARPGASQEARR